MNVEFYKGDIVELLSIEPDTKTQHQCNGFNVGWRYRVKDVRKGRKPYVCCSIGNASYDHTLDFDQIMLHSRPIKNWIKWLFN